MPANTTEQMGEAKLYLNREHSTGHLNLVSQTQPPKNVALEEDDKNIYPVFRAISKIIVPVHFLNLTKNNILKQSAKFLNNQTVYPNHLVDVNQWIGRVLEVKWDESADPPGINVKLEIPKEQNKRIIDGIRLGAIHSVSVGFHFLWEKSHDRDDFWRVLGDEIDGRVVSLVVTKIESYREISLVFQGADPYAKRRAELSAPLQAKDITPSSSYFLNSPDSSPDKKNNKDENQKGGKMKLTRKIAQAIGLELTEFLDESVEETELTQSQFNGVLAQVKLNLAYKEKEAGRLTNRIGVLSDSLSALVDEDVREFSEA